MAPTLVHITTVPMSLTFLGRQLAYLKSRGFTISAISSPGELLDTYGREYDIDVYGVQMPRRISPLEDLKALKELTLLLRRLEPDIVHAHTPKGGLLGMLGATLAGTPTRVYHMRGLAQATATGLKRELLTLTERTSCACAHRVVCVGPSLRDEARRLGLAPADKMVVLHHGSGQGVDARERFDPERVGDAARASARPRLNIPSEAAVIGFVARLVRDKGVLELADTWSNIRATHPEAHLVIVGPAEQRDAVPPGVLDALQRDERVHFTGFTRETPPLYAAMDVVTLPTYREGFPNVPLEAAAMRLPVVATRVTGCVDAVVDGVTGTLVPPRSASALTDALTRYLDDPELRRTHGEAARTRVLERYDPDAIAAAMHDLYLELMQR